MKRLIVICMLSITVMATNFLQPTEAQEQIISTFAGTRGVSGFGGDGMPAISAQIYSPLGLCFDNKGNLYIADSGNNRIRVITHDGIINTIVGTGEEYPYQENIPAINANLKKPYDVAVDDKNNIYIADYDHGRVRKVDEFGTINRIFNSFTLPTSIALDKNGNTYVVYLSNDGIQRLSASGSITTIAGTGKSRGDNIPAIDAELSAPRGLTVDENGNLFFADYGSHRVRKVDTSGMITTIAGTGLKGYSEDGVLSKNSDLNNPTDVVVDKMGNIYIADSGNHRVRKVDLSGIISTVVGTGEMGYSGDQREAIQAKLSFPDSLVFDSEGNLFISDSGNHLIRKVSHVGLDQTTPTPTVTPTITPGPIVTPTPTPPTIQDNRITFDGDTLASNQLTADPPQGFTMGRVSFTTIPAGSLTDGKGMEIKLAPGQGVWIPSQKPIAAPSLAKVSGIFKSSSKSVFVALVALNSPVDGQLAYTNFTGAEIPIEDYRQVNLFYEPPSRQIQVAIQVVNSPQSTLSATVWVDNLNVEAAEPEATDNPVSLEVDGSFDEKGLDKMIVNLNDTDGDITPFFESLTDIAIQLSINENNLAANCGTRVTDTSNQLPFTLLGEVNVRRESVTPGGMMAFVMTNGFQNVGVFRDVNQLPGPSSNSYENLMMGGDFNVNNPDVPIYVVVQNGGPQVDSTIIVDDLKVMEKSITGPIINIDLETINIPLPNLPPAAVPLEMVLIPAGSFMMGSPSSDKYRDFDEEPQHQVNLHQNFYLGKYEVTQAQWKAVMGTNPSRFISDNLPVERVNWEDCQNFIGKLNQLGQGTFRLPTEAEWEYACRAGTTTRFYWGDDHTNSQIGLYAWYILNSSGQTHADRLKLPNAWGLFDMSGNVWEWCQDWYGSYSSFTQTNPTGAKSGSYRVVRGGDWSNDARYCSSAIRYGSDPINKGNIGLRLVRTP